MNEILKFERSDCQDYYKMLGCSIHSTAEQIQKEYKIRALELHPDKNIENEEASNQEFQKLKRAKEILLDQKMRTLYDRWLLGGITMSFEQFQNYTKNNCQSFHWASKKSDPMIDCPSNQQLKKANLERKSSKLGLSGETPVFGSEFIWPRNDGNDLLTKFRNYEI